MKNLFNFLFLGIFVFYHCQVAIGTDRIDPSAAFEVSSHLNLKDTLSHGLLIPRLQLNNITDNTSPVNNPVDGCLVLNTNLNESVAPGFYFWNDDIPQWDRGLYSNETPKSTIIKYSGDDEDYPILDNRGAGSSINTGSSDCLTDLVIDSRSANAGVEPIVVGNTNTFSLLPGDYKITINFAFKFPPCDPANQCSVVANDYYYDGLFFDLRMYQQNANGGFNLSQSLQRKEDGVLAKVNEIHIITQTYTVHIPDNGFISAPIIGVGRMIGSSFNDLEYIIPRLSFIKINKYK